MKTIKWFSGPNMRDVAIVQSHGGPIMLHAWQGGRWKISRGSADDSPYSRISAGGSVCDLAEAKKVAEQVARKVVEDERIKHGKE